MAWSWVGDRLRTGRRRSSLLARLGRGVCVVAIGLMVLVSVAPPADAHGGDETEVGYLLVQQALGHLAHDTTPLGLHLAMEKVDDTLATKDQDGVDVAGVLNAKRALEAGEADRARVLLQSSITEALSNQATATGEQTGTTVVVPALPGRHGLTGRDWAFLAVSLIFLLAGIGLAFRFRPDDSVAELRRRLAGTRAETGEAPGPSHLGGTP